VKYPVDVTFHPSWWHQQAAVDFDEKFFFDAQYRLQKDQDMRRRLWELFGDFGVGEKDPKRRPVLFSDLIACGFLHSQLLGCEVVFKKDNAPTVMCAQLDEDQAAALETPVLDESPLWQRVQAQIDEMGAEFGYVESAVNLMGVQNIAMDLRGQDLFFDYYDEPELAHHLLKTAADLSLDVGKRLAAKSRVLSGGVTSIVKQVRPEVYLTSNCSVTMISNDQYCEYLLGYDTMLAEAFPDFGVHHCGNNMENVIDGYLRIPHLTFIEIGAGSDLARIAAALKTAGREDMVCCIRYSPVRLGTDSPEVMRSEMEAAQSAFGSTGKLCFSCVGIDAGVSAEQVRAYLQTFA